MNLTFNAVLDPVRLSAVGKRGNADLKTPVAALTGTMFHLDWSLSSLFGRQLSRPCPVSESSLVIIDLPKDVAYSLSPQSSGISNAQAIYNVGSRESVPPHKSLMLTLTHSITSVKYCNDMAS